MKIDKMRVEVSNVSWESSIKEINVKIRADGKDYGVIRIASNDDLESMFEFMWEKMGDTLLTRMKSEEVKLVKTCIECDGVLIDEDGYCLGCGRKN